MTVRRRLGISSVLALIALVVAAALLDHAVAGASSPAFDSEGVTRLDTDIPGDPTDPLEQRVLAFLANGARDIDQPELALVRTEVDDLGMRHLVFEQHHKSVVVAGAGATAHVDGDKIVAVTASLLDVGGIDALGAPITEEEARAMVMEAWDGASVVGSVYTVFVPPPRSSGTADFSWAIEVRDDAIPSRQVVFVSARDGRMLAVRDLLTDARNRRTYDAEGRRVLPGTLARSEGDPAVGEPEIDRTHVYARDTYDYFWTRHRRDSYDDRGAPLVSTVHYGVGYANAFWNGEQTVYGDGFAVKDVVAHEWTHAVTEYTAGLVYEWQSGALDESYSDVFGVMVDREDWLLGEDLPETSLAGRPGIRSIANPELLGQPAHTDDWVETCSDEQGVHTNSGITNKAFYNLAKAIGKPDAADIFFRALTVYLHPRSTLHDAREAAIQSARDLFGGSSTRQAATAAAYDSVGITSSWHPDENDCTCAVTTTLATTTFDRALEPLEIAATLYEIRDRVLAPSDGTSFYVDLFYQHTGRVSQLLLLEPELLSRFAGILTDASPGLRSLAGGTGGPVAISGGLAADVPDFITDLAAADRRHGGGELASALEREFEMLGLADLTGLSFDDALRRLADVGRGRAAPHGRALKGPFGLVEVGGDPGDDERAVDSQTVTAYDKKGDRFLTVWLSARNATNADSGFDVYGRFHRANGRPMGSEFRISDDGGVAANTKPAIATGRRGFLVAWTEAAGDCFVRAQVVVNRRNRRDFTLSGAGGSHSPALAHNRKNDTFLLAFVRGSDYLPPSLFGAESDDCGDSASSASGIFGKALRDRGKKRPRTVESYRISDVHKGAFRPQVTFEPGTGEFVVVWEDRRRHASPDVFDLAAQRIADTGRRQRGSDRLIVRGIQAGTVAPWSPRPAIASSRRGYLVTYFVGNNTGSVWRANAVSLDPDLETVRSRVLTTMVYGSSHPGDEPTASASLSFSNALNAYLYVQSAQFESLWGYVSTVTAVRITPSGLPRRLDGRKAKPGSVGEALDFTLDTQQQPVVVAAPRSGNLTFLVVFSKHEPDNEEKDFDIWASRVRLRR